MALRRAVAKCVRRGASVPRDLASQLPTKAARLVVGYHMESALWCVCGWPEGAREV